METNNLQEIWAAYDRKLTLQTQLNKAVLKKTLHSSAERQNSKLNTSNILTISVFITMIAYLSIRVVTFQLTLSFVLGFAAYSASLGLAIVDYLRYSRKRFGLHPDAPIVELRKKSVEMEQFRNRMNLRSRIYALIFAASLWFVITPETRSQLFNQFQDTALGYLFVAMIAGVCSVVVFSLFRNQTASKLDKKLLELEGLEKNEE
jgi:hypothetical protein